MGTDLSNRNAKSAPVTRFTRMLFLPMLISVAMLTGCHKASPIVGTWLAPDTAPNGGSDTWTFGEDGGAKHVIFAKSSSGSGKSVTITSSGTYTLKEDSFSISVGEATAVKSSGTVTHPYPAGSLSGTIKWSDNDHFVATYPKMGETRFTRQK